MALFEARLPIKPEIALSTDPASAKVYVTETRSNGTGHISYLVKVTDFHDPMKEKSCREIAEQIMQWPGAEVIRNPYK